MKTIISDGRDYGIFQGKSPDFGIDYCEHCKIGFTTPFLSDDELAQYYPSNFEAYIPKKSIFAHLQNYVYKADLNRIQKYLARENFTIYEMGAGRGNFLKVAKEKLNTMGSGIAGSEPSENGVLCARNIYGIELEQLFADQVKFSEKYDVVVMRHVLEHINAFEQVLENIYSNGLNNNGALFLKLPRLDSWEAKKYKKYWHHFEMPRHRVHFTKYGIKKLLGEVGFKNIKIIDDVVSTGVLESEKYLSLYAGKKNQMVLKLPKFVLMPICQIIAFANRTKNPGRMIVLAQKQQGK